MRKLVIATVAAASLAGAGGLALSPLASAQTAANPPAPPPAAQPMAPMAMPGGMHGWMGGAEGRGEGPQGWMRHGEMRHAFHMLNTWGLFHRPADLALTPDDVKVIGEAILLRNGQHDWKVGDVTANADHTVSFAFVTAHGDAIAHFAINTQTGRISRTD